MSITLPLDAELSAEVRAALGAGPPLNVFRMMARAPSSLAPFIQLAQSILVGSELAPRLRELAVLRVTHLAGCQYAFRQHVMLGKLVGVTETDLGAIVGDDEVIALDEDGNLACRVADEITLEIKLSDETLARAVERFGQRQATELILACSYFNMVARFLESTRVPLDVAGGRS